MEALVEPQTVGPRAGLRDDGEGGMSAVASSIVGFKKRNGLVVPFHREKIEDAIRKAADAVTRAEGTRFAPELAAQVTDRVLALLRDPKSEFYVHPDAQGQVVAEIEDVQDVAEIAMAEGGHASLVTAYKRYRKQREVARRRIHVQERGRGRVDVTDASLLLVESTSNNVVLPWNRARIEKQLIERARLGVEEASAIAKSVENVLIHSDLTTVGTTLIRELVNNELSSRGYREQLRDLSVYGVPKDLVENMMFTKSTENSNVVNNNPEAVNLGLAELILKQWALDTVYSPAVKRAHDTGAIHVHDLGYPHRVYCSSHSVEYVKKYGLTGLANLNTESHPARSASVLTGHLNTYLASMQANYAGALGIAYINVFYAPYLVGMDDKQLLQVAQELIFNGSQNAFSRGGQTLFLDFNIHSGIPKYLAKVPVVGPGGHYLLRRADGSLSELVEVQREEKDARGYPLMDLYLPEADGSRRQVLREVLKDGVLARDEQVEADLAARGERLQVYGDYQAEAAGFARALLEIWRRGDRHGRVFEFPKCDFHISEETFNDPVQTEIYMKACELASENGSTYFIFDRDEVTLSACCRLRTTIEDKRMLQHPESMRFCGFQNITVNIPQAAFRASRQGRADFEGLCAELDTIMELAVQAHLEKRVSIRRMMSEPGRPLWQIGKTACDGVPYVDLDNCTYIVGLIGLNDAVKFLIGQELHEADAAMEYGLRVVAHMYHKAKKLSRIHNLKFTLEESPAESAARRLAKTDLIYYRDEAQRVVKGDTEDVAYYTNSIHLGADAPVSLVERIRQQAKFHSMIESGAIVHAFVGEEKPSAGAIARLVEEVFNRTQCAQITISPEFTYCRDCDQNARGLHQTCPSCGSTHVQGETRVVGYFSKIENWNKSKRYGELLARQRGRYSVVTADDPAPACPAAPEPGSASSSAVAGGLVTA